MVTLTAKNVKRLRRFTFFAQSQCAMLKACDTRAEMGSYSSALYCTDSEDFPKYIIQFLSLKTTGNSRFETEKSPV